MEGLKVIFRACIILFAVLIIITSLRFTLNAKRAPTVHEAVVVNTELIVNTTVYIIEDIIIGGVKFVISNYISPFMEGEFLNGLRDKLKNESELQPGNPSLKEHSI